MAPIQGGPLSQQVTLRLVKFRVLQVPMVDESWALLPTEKPQLAIPVISGPIIR